MISRTYKVARIKFEVRLQEPLSFMDYSPIVKERIRKASLGLAGLDIKPTRAGDHVPHRTLIQNRDELLPGQDKLALDMSQYEPFLCEDSADADFTITVVRGMDEVPPLGALVMNIHSQEPYFSVYEDSGKARYTLCEDPATFKPEAILCMDDDNRSGVLYTHGDMLSYGIVFQLSTALMIMFTYNAASKHTLLIHASVIDYKGKANIFLGKSGTGKSTHSRLWLSHIQGADLLNDDNPALGFDGDGKLVVYGTPWSGKTPCYRNICAPVGAVVRLEQAPSNSIASESGLSAYASLIGSVSSIRWRREIMDAISDSVEKAAMSGCKFFKLSCLPDENAALLCRKATMSE